MVRGTDACQTGGDPAEAVVGGAGRGRRRRGHRDGHRHRVCGQQPGRQPGEASGEPPSRGSHPVWSVRPERFLFFFFIDKKRIFSLTVFNYHLKKLK